MDNFVNFGAIAAGVGALGFSTGVKNALIQEATKTVDVGKGAAKYLKYSKGFGATLGVVSLINSRRWIDWEGGLEKSPYCRCCYWTRRRIFGKWPWGLGSWRSILFDRSRHH